MKEIRESLTVGSSGRVGTLSLRPDRSRSLLVLGHGAGAGMEHPFMAALARSLAERDVATFRYQFPYMERGAGRPDPPRVLEATVRSAIGAAAEAMPDLPLFAGGKSMGGRITSMVAASDAGAIRGLVFVGYPLHAPGKPSAPRVEHLPKIGVPMLFLQGTRDRLAEIDRMRALCATLGPIARLHVIDDADHSFHVPKRSGRDDAAVIDELAATTAAWMADVAVR